jgi:hypothetical protein
MPRLLLLFICLAANLVAQESYFRLETGYRWDKLDNRAVLYGDVTNRAATQLFQRINSFQIGANTKATFGRSWYVKGNGHYGWIGGGDFRESSIFGDIGGHTWDVDGALAYTFSLHRGICVAPLFGWAYDVLALDVTDVFSTAVITATGPIALSDIDCYTTFQGPFLGVDVLFFVSPCLDLVCGYELHHAEWRQDSLPDQGNFGAVFGQISGFANKRVHHHVWGHLFSIDGTYCFNEWIEAGLSLQYQIWKGQNTGRISRVLPPVLSPVFRHRLIIDIEWASFSALAHVGVTF